MSTFLAKEAYCGWCGSPDAPNLCACKKVCFCNKACLKAAWPEHRLSCPKAASGKSGFSNGDIVKIQGLKSENGRKMNGLLAEVVNVEKDTERVVVLASPESCTIRSVAIKPENIKLHLSVSDAAVKAASLKMTHSNTDQQQHEHMKDIYNRLPSMSGKEIVDRINKESDRFLIQALQLSGKYNTISIKQKEEMLMAGIIDSCLGVFKFPETIDQERDQDEPTLASMLVILGNLLVGGRSQTSFLNPYRAETCRKLAPTILLCSTKKRRLSGMTEQWWSVQPAFNCLVGNCLNSGRETFVLLTTLDPIIITTNLLDYTVLQLTVDPKMYLRRKRTFISENTLVRGALVCKMTAIPILATLVSFRDSTTRQIGLMKVPAGATLAGRTFASCFLLVIATVVGEALNFGQAHRVDQLLTDQIKWTYSMLLKVPSLKELLGGYDTEFGDLRTPLQLCEWAKKKLAATA